MDENTSYVVIFTEWCPGIDLSKELKERIDKGRHWDIEVLERFTFDLITVFKTIQKRKLIHRDIKP